MDMNFFHTMFMITPYEYIFTAFAENMFVIVLLEVGFMSIDISMTA